MRSRFFRGRFWIVPVLCCAFGLSYSNAFAWEHNRGSSHQHERGHERYNYHDGRFYLPWWFGIELVVSAPPVGSIVTSIPSHCQAIVVGGVPYYYYDHIYYRQFPYGYEIVPAPVVVPVQPSVESIIINVPNSNGTYTPVSLVKRGNGYVGPQGEFYSGNPTVEQLKALYGK